MPLQQTTFENIVAKGEIVHSIDTNFTVKRENQLHFVNPTENYRNTGFSRNTGLIKKRFSVTWCLLTSVYEWFDLHLETLKASENKYGKYLIMRVLKRLKTFWQKEKCFFISNFSFCHYVLQKLFAADGSICVCMLERVSDTCSRWLLKTLWPKVKLLMISNFSFGHHVFNFI